MVTGDVVATPENPAQAYQAYRNAESAVFLAGAQGLKYKKEHYGLIVDLSNAGLDYIRDLGDEVLVGAMTTLAELEASPVVAALAGGAICRCLGGVQDAECKQKGTVGGLIAVKPPFSVLLPMLLSLNVDVFLQDKGRMDLKDYLSCPPMGEMVTNIAIAKDTAYTAYMAYRKLPTDEPYLTGAVTAAGENQWRIVVGGRPGIAAIAETASAELTEKGMAVRENVAHLAGEELSFANYGTCSEQERRSLTTDMVRKLIKEAWKGHSRQLQKNKK